MKRNQSTFANLGLALVAVAGLTTVHAGSDPKDTKDMKSMEAPAEVAAPMTPAETLGSKIHGALQYEVSDKYLTPRGLEAHTNSAVVQPNIILFWDLYDKPEKSTSFLDGVTLLTGLWSDIDFTGTPRNRGGNGSNYDEVDPYAGLSFKIFKDWQFDAITTLFAGLNGIAQGDINEDIKLTYHDHFFKDCCPGLTINPFIEYWQTLNQKSPTVFGSNQKGYGVLGMDPTYAFKTIPLTLELPSYTNIAQENFYRHPNGDSTGAGFALISTEIKASTPLSFIPISYGAWRVYAGLQYDYLFNTGLIDTNAAINGGAGASKDSSVYQVHGGLTCFF